MQLQNIRQVVEEDLGSVLLFTLDAMTLDSVRALASDNSWELITASTGLEALERVQSDAPPDVVILDIAGHETETLHTLRWLHRIRPDLPVLLISDSDDQRQKLEAIRLGAQDYLLKPIDAKHLRRVIDSYFSCDDLTDDCGLNADIDEVGDDRFLVCGSLQMRKLRAQAELLARVDMPVLLVGEASTGKETIARFIHKRSVRSGFRFTKLRCGSLSPDTLRNELLGRDSVTDTPKLLDDNKGTVLLTGLVEMPPSAQSLLLEFLQRSNNPQATGTGVRIMATADARLENTFHNRSLRHDLFLKLSSFTIHVPALRQRRDEIPTLLEHFMTQMSHRYGLEARRFSTAVVNGCQNHSWPGNLEELQTFVKRFLVTGDEELVLRDIERRLSAEARLVDKSEVLEPGSRGGQKPDLRSIVQNVKIEAERNAIATALEKTGWNRKAAARLLHVSYRTILYKIQQYQMKSPHPYLAPVVSVNGDKSQGPRGE